MKPFAAVVLAALCWFPCYAAQGGGREAAGGLSPAAPMNLLLIVADDMGFSDLGAFGGDAATPHLDRLAEEGLRLSNFHAAPSCSPSRAQLLSGADNHLVGLGNMGELLHRYPWQQDKPGYEGHLTRRALTVGRVLKEHGYRTYMTGKWHMGYGADQLPSARGFDRSFALLGGTSSHYAADNGRDGHATVIVEDGREVPWPAGAYSSDLYTDKLLAFLELDREDERPFFAYLAYTAPHHPLHAHQDDIDRYAGVFDGGWPALRQRRAARMRSLGITPDRALDSVPYPGVRSWESLAAPERAIQSRLMQVHAAMLDNMDQNIGRVLDYLQSTNRLENTLVVFLSDNGASAQELSTFPIWKSRYEAADNSLDNIGRPDSWTGIGAAWAAAITGPFRAAKHRTAEGGIRVPALLWRPGLSDPGRVSAAFTQIRDIAPTLATYAGLALSPSYFEDRGAEAWAGNSLAPLLEGVQEDVHAVDEAFGWEYREQAALIKGGWKLLKLPPPYGKGQWELIDLSADPGEANDLADAHPGRLRELQRDWQEYVMKHGVILRE